LSKIFLNINGEGREHGENWRNTFAILVNLKVRYSDQVRVVSRIEMLDKAVVVLSLVPELTQTRKFVQLQSV
jgi:hypothetical protein